MKQTTVVVLDDSLFTRETLQQELERDISIKVVGKAANAYEARDQIVEFQPDILVADIYLGSMSGTDFVRQLLPQYYMPVILISSDPKNKRSAEALNIRQFIQKPTSGERQDVNLFAQQILAAIKTTVNGDKLLFPLERLNQMVIAIGASTGGADAIEQILCNMPSMMPPILVTQHMPAQFTKAFAERVNTRAALSAKEAQEGDTLIPGQVYIAPGGKNMEVHGKKGKAHITLVNPTNKKQPCPNVDTLFYSVAQGYMSDAIGILLTGMGRDGAQGLKAMYDVGASTIVQDEASSVVYGMPKAAMELGAADYQLSLSLMAQKCVELLESFATK